MSRLPALLACTLLASALLVTSACRHRPDEAPSSTARESAERLAALAEAYWDHEMRKVPVWATFLGDRRFDELLPDLSPPGIAATRERARALLDETRSLNDRQLSPADRLTRDILSTNLEAEIATEVCEAHLWDVNALDGVQTLLGELPSLHGLTAPEHADSLLIRYRKSGALIDQHIANLRTGMGSGYTAAKVSVQRVLEQLEELLRPEAHDSSWVTEIQPRLWTQGRRQRLRDALTKEVEASVRPALERYRLFLQNEYLPEAREAPGVFANRDGEACYRARIRQHTGLDDLSPDALHQIGLEETAQNVAAMRRLAQALTGRKGLPLSEVNGVLAEDPSRRAADRQALVDFTSGLVARAQARMPQAFGRLPKLGLEVKPIESFRESTAAPGYYYAGSLDEGRPAYFHLNTSNPEGRLLHMLEPLTFHEAVPGHHLQGALAQELPGLPRFRRELGHGAYVEGWAHYAELLADELGLYSGDAGLFAMQSDQALRAVRLVTDTGMHALGWSREQALAYLLENTAEPRDQAEREIDRDIVWPGQALSYKVGQLEILRLRREAASRLGERFDLRTFHDEVLKHGALPLPLLRREVEAWIAGAEASPAG